MRAFLVIASILAAPIGAANAEPDEIRIPVTSADLISEESLAALMARVENAADIVCKQDHAMPLALGGQRDCRKRAVRAAIERTRIEPLKQYYASYERAHKQNLDWPTLAER
ncbi:MAG TPA: UrcA family protein [Caulobacterales bacterium]|nr:UrcA family protein [Caulobacterales bacterium]